LQAPSPREPLRSWKSIAGFLQITVRTAQRWEQHLGLPIRRVSNGEQHTTVVADPAALRSWLGLRQRKKPTTLVSLEYRLIYERSPDAAIITDNNRIIVDANPAACSLLGRRRDEVVGVPITDISAESMRDSLDQRWRNFLRDGRADGYYVLLRPNGTTVEVHYRSLANYIPGQHLSVLRPTSVMKPR
jgi:PAS domain S-box-containing protein